MKRREFMGTAVTLTLGMVWSSVVWRSKAAHAVIDADTADEAADLADHLLQAFPHRRSLQVIGEAFRRGQLGGASAGKACMPDVCQDFLRHLDLSKAELLRMTPAAMRSCIDVGTARDFSEGRIISVDGWLLGETEARLCEVAALRTG